MTPEKFSNDTANISRAVYTTHISACTITSRTHHMMAKDASFITSSGRKLRRSPSTRDQTIRAVYDRDQSASLPTQYRQRKAQHQFISPSARRSQCVSSAKSMDKPQQHAAQSHCASHASRVLAPISSGRANARAEDPTPPQFHASPSASRLDDDTTITNADSQMMDWEQPRGQPVAPQNLDLHPFQSSHFYAQQKNDNAGTPNPRRLYPTEIRPAASFAFEMRAVPKEQVHDQVSKQGGCTCADRNCPLIHYTAPGDTHKNEFYYEPISGTARYVSTAELTAIYLNPDADTYAASRAPRGFEQEWHTKEQYTRPFPYHVNRASVAHSLESGAGGSGDHQRREERHADGHSRDTDRIINPSVPHSAQRSSTTHQGGRAPVEQACDGLEEGDVAMMEVCTPGRLGVRIIEAARQYGRGRGGA